MPGCADLSRRLAGHGPRPAGRSSPRRAFSRHRSITPAWISSTIGSLSFAARMSPPSRKTSSGRPWWRTRPPSINTTRSAQAFVELDVVGRDDDRRAGRIQLVEELHQHEGRGRAERARGLVEDEHLGTHGEHARDRDGLLLPAREEVRWPTLEAPQAHLCKRAGHDPTKLVLGEPEIELPERDVLVHGRGEELGVRDLEDEPHPPAELAKPPPVVPERFVMEAHLARGRPEEAVRHKQEGRFGGPVRADERDLGTLLDLDRDVAEGVVAVRVREPDTHGLELGGHGNPPAGQSRTAARRGVRSSRRYQRRRIRFM